MVNPRVDIKVTEPGHRFSPKEALETQESLREALILNWDEFPREVPHSENNYHYFEGDYRLANACFQHILHSPRVLLWNYDVWEMAIRGHEELVGCVIELPWKEPESFWMWDCPIGNDYGIILGYYVATAPAVRHVDELLNFFQVQMAVPMAGPLDVEPTLTEANLPNVSWYPVLINGKVIRDTWEAEMYAAYRFMHLPFVVEEEAEKPSRQVRRHAERHNLRLPEIRIVQVRKPLKGKGSETSLPSDGHKEYTCQWMVSGHWRKQWYPSVKAHKAIWIDAYVKGDRSKPFKPSKTVYRISR